MRRDA
jgi:hypothetical protein